MGAGGDVTPQCCLTERVGEEAPGVSQLGVTRKSEVESPTHPVRERRGLRWSPAWEGSQVSRSQHGKLGKAASIVSYSYIKPDDRKDT